MVMFSVSPAKASSNDSKRLNWVEVGRGTAALLVVLYHASRLMAGPQYSGAIFAEPWFNLGFLGVDFFFVLSGFIILHVHMRDIGVPGRMVRYGWRRLTRIFPTYWVILAVALVINQTLQSDRAPVTLGWLAKQAIIMPGETAWLGPAWTLRFELLFYSIFSLLLLNKRLGQAALLLWFALILYCSLSPAAFYVPTAARGEIPMSRAIHILTHPYSLNFAFGMLLAWSVQRPKWLLPVTCLLGIIGGAYLIHALRQGVDWFGFTRFPGIGALCAMVLGLLLLISRRNIPAPRALIKLGAISYSLYLSHAVVMGVFVALVARLGLYSYIPDLVIFIGQISVAIICATLIYRLVEVPVLRWAHSKFND